MNTARIVVNTTPIPKARPRFTKTGRVYTPKKTADFERLVYLAAVDQLGGMKPIEGPLSVSMCFELPIPRSWSKKKRAEAAEYRILPTKKPDIDNLAKSAIDALNGRVFKDDSQVCSLFLEKFYSENPNLTIDLTWKDYE